MIAQYHLQLTIALLAWKTALALQAPLLSDKGLQPVSSSFLYSQQWQVVDSPAPRDGGAPAMRKISPILSVVSTTGQFYWHAVAGQGGSFALRALAALKQATSDKRVSKVNRTPQPLMTLLPPPDLLKPF